MACIALKHYILVLFLETIYDMAIPYVRLAAIRDESLTVRQIGDLDSAWWFDNDSFHDIAKDERLSFPFLEETYSKILKRRGGLYSKNTKRT